VVLDEADLSPPVSRAQGDCDSEMSDPLDLRHTTLSRRSRLCPEATSSKMALIEGRRDDGLHRDDPYPGTGVTLPNFGTAPCPDCETALIKERNNDGLHQNDPCLGTGATLPNFGTGVMMPNRELGIDGVRKPALSTVPSTSSLKSTPFAPAGGDMPPDHEPSPFALAGGDMLPDHEQSIGIGPNFQHSSPGVMLPNRKSGIDSVRKPTLSTLSLTSSPKSSTLALDESSLSGGMPPNRGLSTGVGGTSPCQYTRDADY
jgi:hypothetical protein